MTAHIHDAAARAAEAAASPLLARVRQALGCLDKAHDFEGQLAPGDAMRAEAEGAVKRFYDVLEDVLRQIPKPPRSIGDLAALAVVGYWLDDKHTLGPALISKVPDHLEGRVGSELIDAVLSWVGLDPSEPAQVLGSRRSGLNCSHALTPNLPEAPANGSTGGRAVCEYLDDIDNLVAQGKSGVAALRTLQEFQVLNPLPNRSVAITASLEFVTDSIEAVLDRIDAALIDAARADGPPDTGADAHPSPA